MIRRTAIIAGLAAAFSIAAWSTQAQAAKEPHPVLAKAVEQINAIKGRLQQAPKDFGGHKQKAIDALSLATDELRQAIQFDHK